jgi:uncharacterized protein (DUF1697 family)
MSTWIALLRAVNVGGRTLPMAELRRVVEEVGGQNPRTYVQSGNVVFSGARKTAAALEPALTSYCGFEVRVLLRSAADLAAVVRAQPFPPPESEWHVTFLGSSPAAGAVSVIDPTAYGGDEFRVVGSEVYLRMPGGYGRTKLNNTFWERKLNVAGTTRNWKTVQALATMAADS